MIMARRSWSSHSPPMHDHGPQKLVESQPTNALSWLAEAGQVTAHQCMIMARRSRSSHSPPMHDHGPQKLVESQPTNALSWLAEAGQVTAHQCMIMARRSRSSHSPPMHDPGPQKLGQVTAHQCIIMARRSRSSHSPPMHDHGPQKQVKTSHSFLKRRSKLPEYLLLLTLILILGAMDNILPNNTDAGLPIERRIINKAAHSRKRRPSDYCHRGVSTHWP